MKNVLVLGAGKSSPYLIDYLLKNAEENDWFITVGDYSLEQARKTVKSHPRGAAVLFDVNDFDMRSAQIAKNDVVVNMLAPMYQHLVALTCVRHGKHMISVSYEDSRIRDLQKDAIKKDVLILTEMGLDPGIDHMAAAAMIDDVRSKGGEITSFESYGGGLPALDSLNNPLKYVISWNPRNVVMAGQSGAQYLRDDKIKIIPHHYVFLHSWPLEVEGLGTMEAYPNRDSLNYKALYGFEKAHTVIRGTIRYPGWSETWFQIVKLGFPNEEQRIPDLKNKTWAELTEMFLPLNSSGPNIEQRVANFLNISPTGQIMQNLKWLGLFSKDKIGINVETSTQAMTHLLNEKLKLTDDIRDMVVLMHRMEVQYADKKQEERIATMIYNGERGGFTAMAKSVGLPAGILAKLILTGKMPLSGCHIPTHPAIYKPVMSELAEYGFTFNEKINPLG
ncbi:MAG: saccharopine dehydrogenase NADP-binding domain-containing protein [Calditrichae bacterium]|nr:saccharopine dehydrogenase NADP-binding domain-containing protein [Calditrichota bacterium]MCB9059495.1 saccharopine dehydrogenase NADP-binding domain-containing protein [Calditrichia bacterium]